VVCLLGFSRIHLWCVNLTIILQLLRWYSTTTMKAGPHQDSSVGFDESIIRSSAFQTETFFTDAYASTQTPNDEIQPPLVLPDHADIWSIDQDSIRSAMMNVYADHPIHPFLGNFKDPKLECIVRYKINRWYGKFKTPYGDRGWQS
jgi:hypothetical protein